MPDHAPRPVGRRIALIAHDKALLRVALVCNIPVACNRATADFMISSPLMGRSHQAQDPVPGQARHNQAALRAARITRER
jgi:methylglyoxal synthase